MDEIQYEFDLDFQEALLRFIAQDKEGPRALKLCNPKHFGLPELRYIAIAFSKYYSKNKRLPPGKVLFREYLRQLYLTSPSFSKLKDSERKAINQVVGRIYNGPVKGGEDILEAVTKFKAYVQLREVLENVNLKDFSQYESFAKSVVEAIRIDLEHSQDLGTFLVRDARKRQIERQLKQEVFPTPFMQINNWTNAGGYTRGSLICVLSREKTFKTGFLVNLAKGYMRMKKRILYIDLENGQDSIALRFEQSLLKITKAQLLSGDYDEKLLKLLRKYKRLGVEVDIKRMPAYTTTVNHIQNYIDEQYRNYGIRYDNLIIDYVGIMGSLSGKRDDDERISDAYVDVKNLVLRNGYESCWTAHHVNRKAFVREATQFQADDTAKCIDINRHVDALLGINANDEEKAGNVARLEVIEQRDGLPRARMLFWLNIAQQHIKEFTKVELERYRHAVENLSEQERIDKGKNKDL
jgi:hypothetical protein